MLKKPEGLPCHYVVVPAENNLLITTYYATCLVVNWLIYSDEMILYEK